MESLTAAVKAWIASLGQPADRAHAAYVELGAGGQWTFAKLMLMAAEMNTLVSAVH
jgi:NAD-specific glutamate dehydrogenase